MQNLKEIAKDLLTRSEVVYITSDGVPFFDLTFATNHKNKFGLELFTFEKEPKKEPKKKKNNP